MSILMSAMIGALMSAVACSDEPNFELLAPQSAGESLSRAGTGSNAGLIAGSIAGSGAEPSAGQVVDQVAGQLSADPLAGQTSAGVELAGQEAGSPPFPMATSALEGRWVSEGVDISPILSDPSVGLTRLAARFETDQRFEVEVTNGDGYTFELSGTYTLTAGAGARVTDEGVAHELTLYQTYPETSTSVGLWRVEGDLLTYEVVQVEPPLPGGQTPPTPSGGFGSTNSGALGDDNVQRYRRQP